MCWYLLFSGSSPDGRGEPDYVGRTRHKDIAKKHFDKVDYNNNLYSTGKVMIANDFKFWRANSNDFE